MAEKSTHVLYLPEGVQDEPQAGVLFASYREWCHANGYRLGFPSARGQEAIRHILVPHDPSLGTQEESASREVEEVVREVLRHAGTRPRESLGVITMASSTRTGYRRL